MSSYGEKYRFSLEDFHGNTKKIIIDELDYAGASSNITNLQGVDPATLDYAGEDKELYEEYVFGSKLQLNLWATSEGQWDEFLSVSDRQYRVTIKDADTVATKYTGSYTITALASNSERYSYYEPTGDFSLDHVVPMIDNETPCNQTKLRISIGGIVKATYNPIVFFWDSIGSEYALHQLISILLDNDGTYEGEKNSNNNYYKIKKTGSYTFADFVSIEKWWENCPSTPDQWLEVDTDNFGDGYTGDNFQLKVDEAGVVTTFFDYTLQSCDSKQDIISAAIDAINTDADYKAEQDVTNPNKILVEYTGAGDASSHVLSVVTDSVSNDWNITADGLNTITTEAFTRIWQGFIIPGISDRKYGGTPYITTIEATDGIADLKSFNYDYGEEMLNYIRVIALVLQETGMNLNIYSAADVYEDGMDISQDPLYQLYIQQESIANKNGKDVLKELLKPFGYEIRQHKGVWLIKPVNAIGDISCVVFDYQGNPIDTDTVSLKKYISNKTDYENSGYGVNQGQDAMLRLQAARKGLLYLQNYGLKNQLLKDPLFSIFQNSGNLLFWNGDTDYIQNSDKLLEFNAADVRIWQEIDITDENFEFEISYSGAISIQIILNEADSDVYYYYRNGFFLDSPYDFSFDDEDASESIEVDMASTEKVFKNLQIAIISDESGAVVEKAKMKVGSGNYKKGIAQYLYYPSLTGYKKEQKEIEYLKGDVPSASWALYKYLNLLLLSDDSITGLWDTKSLARLTSGKIAQEILQSSRIVEGTFMFKNFIGAGHNIQSTFDSNIYRFAGGSYSLKFNRFQGTWIEINKTDPTGLTIEDRLFEGRPSGTATYNSNKSSFSGGGGGGGTFELPNDLIYEADLESAVQGRKIDFIGNDLDSEGGISLNHGLGRTNIIIILAVNGVPINPSNYYREYATNNQVKIKITQPYEDTTKFTARFL